MVKSLSFHVVLKGDERVDKPFVSFSVILLISSAIQKKSESDTWQFSSLQSVTIQIWFTKVCIWKLLNYYSLRRPTAMSPRILLVRSYINADPKLCSVFLYKDEQDPEGVKLEKLSCFSTFFIALFFWVHHNLLVINYIKFLACSCSTYLYTFLTCVKVDRLIL